MNIFHLIPHYVMFQQDNVLCHAAKSTLDFFKSNNISVIEWPALSPDLNYMENVLSILSRKVYDNDRQSKNANELWEIIQQK